MMTATSHRREVNRIKERLGTVLALLERDIPAIDSAARVTEEALALLKGLLDLLARETIPKATGGER